MSYESKVSAPREPFAAVGCLTAADLYAAAGLFRKLPESVRRVVLAALEGIEFISDRGDPKLRRMIDNAAAECRALLDAMGGE